MTANLTFTEALLRREQIIVLTGLGLITGLAWGWILIGAGTGMNVLAMTTWHFPPPSSETMVQNWSVAYALIIFFMWWIMMIAMMTPSAAPMILLYGRAHRFEQNLGKLKPGVTPTFIFALGYLVAWGIFSLAATGLQWGVERAGLIHQMLMWSINPHFSALLLIAAGTYQFTHLKNVCLTHCRSPAKFLAEHFKPGWSAAFTLGWKHGFYCLGCCWFLMALLFAGGIMNLVWIVGLAVYVLLEKVAAYGHVLARTAGIVMIGAGIWLLTANTIG